MLETYSELGEFKACQEALSGTIQALDRVDLPNAAHKARLVRKPDNGDAPVNIITKFADGKTKIEQQLLKHEAPQLLQVAFDVKPQELES